MRSGNALIISCILIAAFFTVIPPAAHASTLTVGPGQQYNTIQAAINNAAAGDTILVYSGTYRENVNVNKAVTLKGFNSGAGTPTIDGRKRGDVVAVSVDGARIEGMRVTGSGKGMSGILVKSDGNMVAGNTIEGCGYGIRIDQGSTNTVTGNNVNSNTVAGISIYSSDRDTVADNVCNDNRYGIEAYYTVGTAIAGNMVKGSREIELYVEQIRDAVIAGNSIVYSGYTNNGKKNVDGIGMRYGTNVTMENNYVDAHYYGLKVYYSSDVNVLNNELVGSGVNVHFNYDTHDSRIKGNTVRNGVDNIYVAGTATRITIEDNVAYNGREGIYLISSGNHVVRNNEVYGNTIGIRLSGASNNLVTGNSAHDNQNGLTVELESNGNQIYLNDFVGNSNYQATATGSNVWTSGVVTYSYHGSQHTNKLGNRYSDYAGSDGDGDGIGDGVYSKNGVTDAAPLIETHAGYAIVSA